ncbi:hypothetical protein [Streptomyces sp. ALI-76-A]|uniref:hypothetical protein n=1 Tax=Streptomyces sp. ALI-76-A TaxID=3025736 RepID=UPI00256F0515|nr:hypothetical protein [Streptomyces sp. ALI-76-A]MDL5202268.1 hypothetical protein [Streptomyces sp. ALI-76-A]
MDSQLIAALLGGTGVATGGLIAGAFSLLKGRQENATQERKHQLEERSRHRDVRRDIYAQFLKKAGQVSELEAKRLHDAEQSVILREITRAGNRGQKEYTDQYAAPLKDAMGELIGLAFLVELEGPESLVPLAQSVVVVHREVQDIIQKNRADHGSRSWGGIQAGTPTRWHPETNPWWEGDDW